jgi:hypothetical protein
VDIVVGAAVVLFVGKANGRLSFVGPCRCSCLLGPFRYFSAALLDLGFECVDTWVLLRGGRGEGPSKLPSA